MTLKTRIDIHRQARIASLRDEISDMEREADQAEWHARHLRDIALDKRGELYALEEEVS